MSMNKIKSWGKQAGDATWKGLDSIGQKTNKFAGKYGVEGFWPTDMASECNKAARILHVFTSDGDLKTMSTPVSPEDSKKTQKVVQQIPPKVLQQARGLAIFTVCRTGFGWSAASGSGIVIARLPDGSWSGPSGILLHTIGVGLIAGADIYDVVLVLRTDRAVKEFTNPKVSLGAELSVAVGPHGGGSMLEAGVARSPCWSYVKSKGLYAGIQLDGNIVIERKDENARFYQRKPVTAKEILNGSVHRPTAAQDLVNMIEAAANRTDHIQFIPPSPPRTPVPATSPPIASTTELTPTPVETVATSAEVVRSSTETALPPYVEESEQTLALPEKDSSHLRS